MILVAQALAQVVSTGPFTGSSSEGFESFALTTTALPCATGTLGGLGDVCAPDANVGGVQIRDELFLGGCLATPFAGDRMAGSNDGALEIVFDEPVARFGGRFTTHAAIPGSVVLEAFDLDGVELGSVTGSLTGCTWQWQGLEVAGGLPIHSVRIRHTLNNGALIDIDALQADTACAPGTADADADGAPACIDCDDTDPDAFPGAIEACNGLDDDCDGDIDEEAAHAPLADQQDGVCTGTLAVCAGGAWVEPDYAALPGYEASETSCDGLDNDCDGATDVFASTPPVGPGLGVCLDLLATCDPEHGWSDPPESAWPELVGFEATESTCDGLDNDCDGEIDEDLTAPAADEQRGVCEGAAKVCDGAGGWREPDYTALPGYNASEVCGDDLDNDCNGGTDEYCVEAVGGKGCSTAPLPHFPWRR